MSEQNKSSELRACHADITTLAVDAVVNAARRSLLGGGGVDGAIHGAAGPELLNECRTLGGCEIGEARITKGYNLPAPFVIHTVGPIWRGGSENESEHLENCYRNSLALALENGVSTIAFPGISTGVFGFPVLKAARIAVSTVKAVVEENPNSFSEIIFCCFSIDDLRVYNHLLDTAGEFE